MPVSTVAPVEVSTAFRRLAKASFAPMGASPYTVAFEKLQVLETVRFRAGAGEIARLKLSGKFDDRLSHSF